MPDLFPTPGCSMLQPAPQPTRLQRLLARLAGPAAATAPEPLAGAALTMTLVDLLAPTYGHDPADLDEVLRSFIVADAARVAVRMAELGVVLVPAAVEEADVLGGESER